MPVSKPRKKKSARTASKADRSGNPATRRVDREAAALERRVSEMGRQSSGNPFVEYQRQLDRKRMKNAAYDAEPLVADLLDLDGTAGEIEDELCRQLGRTLAEQDEESRAALADGGEALAAYSPAQLLDAVTDIAAREASQAATADADPQTRDAAWRLLLAVSRITPYPAAELAIAVTDQVRAMAASPLEGATASAPQGTTLWCRDVYGTRFAITAPFAGEAQTPAAEGTPRWYLWDIDVCGSDAYTVGSGYFPDAEAALAAWRLAVGRQATAGAVLEPVTDAALAARLLPGLPGFWHPGGENEEQYAEFHRCRRLAQALRTSEFLQGNATGSGARPGQDDPWFDLDEWDGKDAWIGEFAAWRAERRPGTHVIPDDFPIAEGRSPLTEDELYRELVSSWFTDEFPEFAYCCSPHRIALLCAQLTDFYEDDFARLLVQLIPDLTAWLAERASLPADLVRQRTADADDTLRSAADATDGKLNPLNRVQE